MNHALFDVDISGYRNRDGKLEAYGIEDAVSEFVTHLGLADAKVRFDQIGQAQREFANSQKEW